MSSPDRSDPIFAKAAELPAEISPERDLWPGIAARLNAPAHAQSAQRTGWQWPAAVAAGLAMIALTATVTWRIATVQSTAPPASILAQLMQPEAGATLKPGVELTGMRNELLGSLQTGLNRLPPDSQRIVIDNLLEIRASLKAIEAALSQDPDDASLQQLLYTTYEQELEMLVNLKRVTQSLPAEVET